jgi:uncharacterized protein (TIGR03118 family)
MEGIIMIRMEKLHRRAASVSLALAILLGGFISGCRNDEPVTSVGAGTLNKIGTPATVSGKPSGMQVNLVSDIGGFGALRTDPFLANAWGLSINPANGIVWISTNHSGRSVVYNASGAQVRPPVLIPSSGADSGGAPTGIVFNSTTGFVIPSTGQTSRFIFAGEDGIISAWSGGNVAVVVANRSSFDAVYKGLALAQDGGSWFLYATNFKGNGVDVFDDHFQLDTTRIFRDPALPSGYAPFNIQSVGGMLYVTYALQKGPDNEDDQAGPGNGYVDVYKPDGHLVRRFASRGVLNSPWGVASLQSTRGDDDDNLILIGNFGDGRINLFRGDGKYAGQLADSTGSPITISGLWALEFGTPIVTVTVDSTRDDHGHDHGDEHGHGKGGVDSDTTTTQRLYFTAGPNDENNGLFGYLLLPPARSHEGDHGEGGDHHGEGDDNHGGQGGDHHGSHGAHDSKEMGQRHGD